MIGKYRIKENELGEFCAEYKERYSLGEFFKRRHDDDILIGVMMFPILFMKWLFHLIDNDWRGLDWRMSHRKEFGVTTYVCETWFKSEEEVFEIIEQHKKQILVETKKKRIRINNL